MIVRLLKISTGVAILLSWVSAVGAATDIYTDKAAWADAVAGQFQTEDFSDAVLNEGLSFESSESGHINPAQENYQDVLSSNSQNEPRTTWHFARAVKGFGGNWWLGGPGGSGNSLRVYVKGVYIGAISSGFNGGFWGFVSDTAFSSVTLIGADGIHQQNYSLDDMAYAFSRAELVVPAVVLPLLSGP
jgi:hypothetical protein